MKVSDAIADILRREGVETIIGYPVNHILERGAAAGIRPIIVRQERIGLHMAEAGSRGTTGPQPAGAAPTTTAGPKRAAPPSAPEPLPSPKELAAIMRRAFTRLKSGRGGPCLV